MFALALRYLNGWAMAAADGAKKQQAEWPPHPDRVFMALAAAWFETGEDPAEGAALRWLEDQPAPAIVAPPYAVRSPTTSYVPVNDARMGRKIPNGHALDKLKDTPSPNRYKELLDKLKQAGSERRRLKALEQRLDERFPQGRPVSLRPEPGRWASYRPVEPPAPGDTPHSLFDPNFLVFTLTGRRLSLPATLKLTTALRGLLLKETNEQPYPEWFSGHRADGGPTKDPHMALFPLPFVDAEHADGRVMGLGLALPDHLDPHAIGRYLEPILLNPKTGLARQHRLFAGDRLECGLEMELREQSPRSLRPSFWTCAFNEWASVTPVALDRHYDFKRRKRKSTTRNHAPLVTQDRYDDDAKEWERKESERVTKEWERAANDIRTACTRIGLPEPTHVDLHPVSWVRGAPHAREFPNLIRKSDGGRRYHIHARLTFAQPVTGPILLGAGRFRGYGLFRPMDEASKKRKKTGSGGQAS